MACVMRVSGRTSSIRTYLERSAFAGRVIPGSELRSGGKSFNIDVSSANIGDLSRQVRDAIRFLSKDGVEIRRLSQKPGIKALTLDFALKWKEDSAAQTATLPVQLIQLAGALAIGIDVSHYAEDGGIIEAVPPRRHM